MTNERSTTRKPETRNRPERLIPVLLFLLAITLPAPGQSSDIREGHAPAEPQFSATAPSLASQSTVSVDSRGRYVMRLQEGAHTLEISSPGYTTAWRQVIVPAGASVVPIDVILDPLGPTATAVDGEPISLQHGGATPVTLPVALTVPAGSAPAGTSVTLTSVGQQSLAGLLPLGWSPLASAEVRLSGEVVSASVAVARDGDETSGEVASEKGRASRGGMGSAGFQPAGPQASSLASPLAAQTAGSTSGSTLSFSVPADEILVANQTLSAVAYDSARDEWIVLDAVVSISESGQVSVTIPDSWLLAPGSFSIALVYPDDAADLTSPPVPSSGSPLRGVDRPEDIETALSQAEVSMDLDPRQILPTQRATITVSVNDWLLAPGSWLLPSGTPVQAWIDEELTLADGSTVTEPPFKTDLILYRDLDGSPLEAKFHLAPSVRAREVFLSVGYERIRLQPYPYELARGTVVGPEGGRVSGDGDVVIEIPAGATLEPISAESRSLTTEEITTFGTLEGFRIAGGFELQMQRLESGDSGLEGEQTTSVELWEAARATFSVADATETDQVIIAKIVDDSPFGRIYELATRTEQLTTSGGVTTRLTTLVEDPTLGLPISGITTEGRYLILVAEQPVAWAWGRVENGAGRPVTDAQVLSLASELSAPLGVSSLTPNALFALPVVAEPAAPFALRPRSRASGDGALYTHAVSPAPDEIVPVYAITLAPQPPVVTSVSPPDGATGVSLTTNVRVDFSPGIDTTSVTGSTLVLTDTLIGEIVAGTISADPSGITWSLAITADRPSLAPATRYAIAVSPSIRGANGAPLGATFTSFFTTLEQITSTEIDASKIRITIPDDSGRSTVNGLAGALPAGAQALVVRRGRDFATQYQATAATDGSFTIALGDCSSPLDARRSPPPCDVVAVTDQLQLYVTNDIGNLIAIVPLTPFALPDGSGFVAPAATQTTFTTDDGITVTVPAGAFDQPTLVTVTPETSAPFADVPSFSEELTFATAIDLDLDCTISEASSPSVAPGSPLLAPSCVAREKLQISIPVPSDAPADRQWLLGRLGESTRGPRVMIVDTLRIDGNQFRTDLADTTSALVSGSAASTAVRSAGVSPAGSQASSLQPTAPVTTQAATVKDLLMGVRDKARYTVIDISIPGTTIGWATTSISSDALELHFDQFRSLYVDSLYVDQNDGVVAFPMVTGQPFTVIGVNTQTALKSFEKLYDPLTPTDPGTPFVLDPPDTPGTGPFPLFGTPFSIDQTEIEAIDQVTGSLGKFELQIDKGIASLALPATGIEDDDLTLVNFTTGKRDSKIDGGLSVKVGVGDRLGLVSWKHGVSDDALISVVFDQAIEAGDSADPVAVDAFLRNRLKVYADGEDVSSSVRFRIDSSGRRITAEPLARLRAGTGYYLVLQPNLVGAVSGLKIGQRKDEEGNLSAGLTQDLYLPFNVREVGGTLGAFELSEGAIRESLLIDNILLMSARDAGILAFETTDPATIDGLNPRGRIVVSGDAWGLARDAHGRIFGTVIGDTFGSLRSWDFEELVEASTGTNEVLGHRSSTLISWSPSADSLSATSATLPVAVPRKLFVVTQDADPLIFDTATLPSGWSASPLDDKWYELSGSEILQGAGGDDHPYLVQRITVENVTRGGRWSADAYIDSPAAFTGVVAKEGDQLRITKNLRAWAVVSLFGHGIGVYDLNAMESNDADVTAPADWTRPREILSVSTGENDPPIQNTVSDLRFNSDVSAIPRAAGVDGYGLNVREGILDFALPVTEEALATQTTLERGIGFLLKGDFTEEAKPASLRRLDALRATYELRFAVQPPVQRLSGSDVISWMIPAIDNRPVAPPSEGASPGVRGSIAGSDASRDYLLAAAGDLGLLVIEAGGSGYLQPSFGIPGLHIGDKLVDVIWLPAGVFAVRSVPERDLAVVVDGEGYVHLVDLSRVDERWTEIGQYRDPSILFPSASDAIMAEFPRADHRVIWRSEQPLANGTLAPVLDPETGILYTSKLQGTETDVSAVLDPKLDVLIDLGDGLGTLGAILPLGVPLPAALESAMTGPTASASAFRVAMTLPGDIDATGTFSVAVESERVPGAVAPQTASPLPPAHLRTIDGQPLPLHRDIPAGMAGSLRHQRMFNRFVSGWVVPLADPRASIDWSWPSGTTSDDKEAAGCSNCDRPDHLKGDATAPELLVSGWTVMIRPDLDPTSAYGWLADGRLDRRFPSTPVDTVRPTDVLVHPNNPPVATGLTEGTIYLHSGELELGSLDLDAGGYNDWNVLVDRTYRSATIGHSPLGSGWDSSLFRRLRPLPDGNVEYRDGAGGQWLFRRTASGWIAPEGLPLALARTADGWMLRDVKRRLLRFDGYGRLISESDDSYEPAAPGSGNVISYLYDTNGRLARVIDSLGRPSSLAWADNFGGRLLTVTDWRNREVRFGYDALGRLASVNLPVVENIDGIRPELRYGYVAPTSGLAGYLGYGSNLTEFFEPGIAQPRAQFSWAGEKMWMETWATNEKVNIDYQSDSLVNVTDALGQTRAYTIASEAPGARAHLASLTEKGIRTVTGSFGQLPPLGPASYTNVDRIYELEMEGGYLSRTLLQGVGETEISRKDAASIKGALAYSVASRPVTTSASGSSLSSESVAAAEITRQINYQDQLPDCGDCYAHVQSVSWSDTVQSFTVERPEANRANKSPVATNNSVVSQASLNDKGAVTSVTSTGGTVEGGAGAQIALDRHGFNGKLWERGAVSKVDDGGLETKVEYPDANTVVETDPRGIVTTTRFDQWDRIVAVEVSGEPGTSEKWYYDSAGRLRRHERRQGTDTVSTHFVHDKMGRLIERRTNHIEVAGIDNEITTTVAYDLQNRTIATTLPSGSVRTETLDGLGRMESVTTTTGELSIGNLVDEMGYDIAGNLSYYFDGHKYSSSAFDFHGRRIRQLNPDGTRVDTEWTALGSPRRIRTFGADGELISDQSFDYTTSGRLDGLSAAVDETQARDLSLAWDGAGRTSGVDVSGRAAATRFDHAGRVTSTNAGAGSASTGVSESFVSSTVTGHQGYLPSVVEIGELGAATYDSTLAFDSASRLTNHSIGSLESAWKYNEAGQLVQQRMPDRGEFRYERDSRGSLTREVLPDQSTIDYSYDSVGAQIAYRDQTSEVTSTQTDLIGRPLIRTYADGTSEAFTWKGRQLSTYTDRQGRLRSYTFDDAGRLVTISVEGQGVVEKIEYGLDGRLSRWATPGAAVLFLDYDLDGNPTHTAQERFANGSGTGSAPELIDRYEQTHQWNVHGERSSWTMPSYNGFAAAGTWTESLTASYDPMGNLEILTRALSDGTSSTLMSTSFRNAGRPNSRMIQTPSGAVIERNYDYDETTGQIDGFRVSANGGQPFAGSLLEYDGIQVADQLLIGISGETRHNLYDYDDRSRLQAVLMARRVDNVVSDEVLDPADFREALARPQDDPLDPPSLDFAEEAGHKIDALTKGNETFDFNWNGAERQSDGRFAYTFDAQGRLIEAREIVTPQSISIRRVLYIYGADRLVGRRAGYANLLSAGTEPLDTDWKIEDRNDVLESDGLPAETTFVWDPVTDTIVAIYRAGASANPAIDANGGLVRQIVHGGLSYDDPVEVSIARTGEPTLRLYPVYDEIGGGQLQAVLNESGEIVSRASSNGAYGEESFGIPGPAIDRISISATTDSTGALSSMELELRSTEILDAATIASGTRLVSLDAEGSVLTSSSVTPLLDDPWTVRWSLTSAQWSELSVDASAISVAATDQLRAAQWGGTSVLPVPGPLLGKAGMASSGSLPVEHRATLASLSSWLSSLGADAEGELVPYDVEGLHVFASTGTTGDPSSLIVAAPFHAHPWQEPLTELNYLRARWYDPDTGTFLSPDPLGYQDSSNLYAFCAGDPINCSDPTGLAGYFFDGTGNDRAKMVNPTNVAKLEAVYRGGNRWYYEGVGSDWYTLGNGGLYGLGGRLRLEAAYEELVKQFNETDDRTIDIFGFSRGGALAVAFANMIAERGIPIYSRSHEKQIQLERGETVTVTTYSKVYPTVRFLGIFDVVGSFGLPGNATDMGYDLSRPTNVRAIRHAVSLDERRRLFPLTSMLDLQGTGPSYVIEKGFRGSHSDVGGGYEDNDELAQVALRWMWDEAVNAGIRMGPLSPDDQRADPFIQHDESSFLTRTYNFLRQRNDRVIYYQGRRYRR
ncbi:MAG: DUF2235 domain-containing protein [Acidobacteria bacterium]|nr:DUF2235 domain-containing protein [Acidobacteriota bacterium]